MLDCGSYCNFMSYDLLHKLNLNPRKIKNVITVQGISGIDSDINEFAQLKFQLKLLINNQFHFINFKEKFLLTNNIPKDLLFGNIFMNKYELHYSYTKRCMYSSLKYDFKKKKFNIKNEFKNINLEYFISTIMNKFSVNPILSNNEQYSFSKRNNFNSKHNKSFTNFYKLSKNIQNFYLKSKNVIKRRSKFNSNKTKINIKNKKNKLLNKNSADQFYHYNYLIHTFLSNKPNETIDPEEPKLEDITIPYQDLAKVFSKQEALRQ